MVAKSLFVIGAGKIGRAYTGRLFSRYGYRIDYVDILPDLVSALNDRGQHTVRLVTNTSREDVLVSPVTCLSSTDIERTAELIAHSTLGATSVGARALSEIAPVIARGIELRAARQVQAPLNIVLCENLYGAPTVLRDLVVANLEPFALGYMQDRVSFVETVVGIMVPEPPAELIAQDRTVLVTEPYNEFPINAKTFLGPLPEDSCIKAIDDFDVYTPRKLYMHNAGHAVLGYLGYQKGYTLCTEALVDADIRQTLNGVMHEAIQGLAAVYGSDSNWLKNYAADLMERFANYALADPIIRLARDPLRKLAPHDRLVGAARLAEQAGILPLNLAKAIAAALAFDAPEDTLALEMQAEIAQRGVAAVLSEVCEIDPGEPLGQAVLNAYAEIKGLTP